MDTLQIIILSLIQGLTEFLPISSSAHLILVPAFTNWQDQGQAFDVALHVGSLIAVIIYFRGDITNMLSAWVKSLITYQQTDDSRLAWAVLFGTIPVGLAGLTFKDYIETDLRGATIIAIASIAFGLLLWYADWRGKRTRNEYTITWRDVVIIGCAQAVALIPGTSRSGITMTAGLIVGLTRSAAARFSFLLSIPTIILSGGLKGIELVKSETMVDIPAMMAATILSGIAAYLCIHYFLKLLENTGVLPFVIYRVLLGIFILSGIYIFGIDFSVNG